jgi:F1F0 ATPase subunit 2
MTEFVYLTFPFIAGLILGVLFFGGLWLTVKKMVVARMPALLFLGSFVFRTAITLSGFYYMSLGNWRRLLICGFGFLVARFAVIYYTKSKNEMHLQYKKENGHEA